MLTGAMSQSALLWWSRLVLDLSRQGGCKEGLMAPALPHTGPFPGADFLSSLELSLVLRVLLQKQSCLNVPLLSGCWSLIQNMNLAVCA